MRILREKRKKDYLLGYDFTNVSFENRFLYFFYEILFQYVM